jgi:hypothetical protein
MKPNNNLKTDRINKMKDSLFFKYYYKTLNEENEETIKYKESIQ